MHTWTNLMSITISEMTNLLRIALRKVAYATSLKKCLSKEHPVYRYSSTTVPELLIISPLKKCQCWICLLPTNSPNGVMKQDLNSDHKIQHQSSNSPQSQKKCKNCTIFLKGHTNQTKPFCSIAIYPLQIHNNATFHHTLFFIWRPHSCTIASSFRRVVG
jgi:hypothetical protein